MTLHVALIEPYMGGSHEAWATGYARHSSHRVSLVTHEARFWKWRMQGSYLTLAAELEAVIDSEGPVDAVLASSMLHLPAFLGAARPLLGGTPAVLYFHESQLSYPLSPQDRPDEAYPMINWGSAAVADLVLFNSEYHRKTFFEAVPMLLRRFPDYQHGSLVSDVEKRSEVLPVGVDLRRFDGVADGATSDVPVILWNQRWEFDKGPAEFASAVTELVASGYEFEVVMTGERFVGQPDEFEALPAILGERLVHFGFAEDYEYRRLVAGSDIVVSTAIQEFFGIAVTEAMYAGAVPVLPDRLVYPERLPERLHPHCLYAAGELVGRLEWVLNNAEEAREIVGGLSDEMLAFDWSAMAPRYDAALASVASQ